MKSQSLLATKSNLFVQQLLFFHLQLDMGAEKFDGAEEGIECAQDSPRVNVRREKSKCGPQLLCAPVLPAAA